MKEDVILTGDFSFNSVMDALFWDLVCVLDKCIEM